MSFPKKENDIFIPITWLDRSKDTEISDITAKAFGLYRNASGILLPADTRGVSKG